MSQEPKSAEPECLRAQKLFALGHFDEAIELIESAATRQPSDSQTLVRCAQAFGYCYEISRAEEMLDRALEIGTANLKPQIALVFQQIFRPDKAIEILEQLRGEQSLALPYVASLAQLYEQSNRQDEAIQALRECVDQAPFQPQPKVLLARLERQAGNLNAAEDLLGIVVSSAAPVPTLVHAWSEMTLVRDQQAQFAQAIDAIEKAKTLLRQDPSVQQQARRSLAINAAFEHLYAQLHEPTIQAWSRVKLGNAGMPRVAHLLGFPRSGTTLLEQVLDAHPKIRSASERAVFTKAIFPAMCQDGEQTGEQGGGQRLSLDALQHCSVDRLNMLRQRYVRAHESIAGTSLQDAVHLDKNPNHTSLLLGLYRLFPEAKFVFALRDPRDVIVSTYMRFFALSEFSASYLTWESTCAIYAHEMNVWLRMRSLLPNDWIEVKYEDTVADLKATACKVTELLGVDWDEGMLNYRDDQRKFVHSPTHAEVRKPVYGSSVGRWKNYESYLAPQLDRLTPFLKAFGYA